MRVYRRTFRHFLIYAFKLSCILKLSNFCLHFLQICSTFTAYLKQQNSAMAATQKMTLLPRSNFVLMPTQRYTWSKHLIAHDTFWKRAEKEPVEACPSFEFVDSGSTGVETPLAHHVYEIYSETVKTMYVLWSSPDEGGWKGRSDLVYHSCQIRGSTSPSFV